MADDRAQIHLLEYWAVVVRRRWLIVLCVLFGFLAALIGSFVATPRYRAAATLQIDRQTPDILTFQDVSRTDYAWTAYEDFYQTQYRILASEAVARAAAERLDLDVHPGFAPDAGKPGLLTRLRRLLPSKGDVRQLEPLEAAAVRVLGGLQISPVEDSQLVEVAWVGLDPALAARIANAVVDAYIQFNIQASFTTSDQAREFLVDQIAKLKDEVAAIESRLQEYGEAKRIVSIDDSNNITLKALADLAEQRTRAQSALAEARAAYQALRASDPASVPAVGESALITRREQESAAQRLRRDAVEFANLQSEVHEKRQTLNSLIARQNEMTLSSRLKDLDVTSSNIRVVDRAKLPVAAAWPRTKLNVAVGLIAGLLVGIGLAFLLEHLDNTINAPAQLEALTALPLLAVVPRHGPRPRNLRRRALPAAVEPVDLIACRDGKSPTSEAFRGLRTALMLSSPGEAPRRILVTSPSPQEGKSVTAMNLSVVFAQLGRRVLLVDADLRRPRLHRAFECDASRGLTTYLSGIESDLDRLVVRTAVEGLDVVPAGPIPPNPVELLDSQRFNELAPQQLAAGYDHVVFDSPPTLSVADATITANAVDATIVVVRAERTSRQSLTLALSRFANSGVQPTGIVLTDLAAGGPGYGQYYYTAYGDAEDDTLTGSRRTG